MKLAARVYWINLHFRFARASSRPVRRWRKLYRTTSGPTRSLVARLPQPSSLAVCKFHATSQKRCEQGYKRWVQNFDAFIVECCGAWSASEWSQPCTWAQQTYFWFSPQEFSMVSSYTELKKPQNCQNWAVGACAGMGAYPGQYSKTFLYKKEMLLVGTLPVRGVWSACM